MSDTIIKFDEAALALWKRRLDSKRGAAVAQILSFAAECYAFQQDCQRVQGGSMYSAKMAEWFGIREGAAGKWAQVGGAKEKLCVATQTLPPSMETLYELVSLPPEVIAEQVTEKTTQREAREMKAQHKKTVTTQESVKTSEAPNPPQPAAPPVASTPQPYCRGWRRLIVRRLGITVHGQTGSAIKKRLDAAGVALPYVFSTEEQADAFISEYVRVIGIPKDKGEENARQARDGLTEAQSNKVNAAIKAETARLQAAFHEQLEAELKRRLAIRIAALDEWEERLREQEAQDAAARASIIAYMTKDEFNLVLNCLHPDRVPEDRRERFARAFTIFNRLEVYINRKIPLSVLREHGWAK